MLGLFNNLQKYFLFTAERVPTCTTTNCFHVILLNLRKPLNEFIRGKFEF